MAQKPYCSRLCPKSFVALGIALLLALFETAQAQTTSSPPPGKVLGPTDERRPSDDPAVGRLIFNTSHVCTVWLVSNGAFLSAGHCFAHQDTDQTACPNKFPSISGTVQFNVPLSGDTGKTNNPPPKDSYALSYAKPSNSLPNLICQYTGHGDTGFTDWAILAVGKNSLGEYAPDNQQAFYRPAPLIRYSDQKEVQASLTSVSVVGFGTDGPPPGFGSRKGDPRNRLNVTQQGDHGPLTAVYGGQGSPYRDLAYQVDTNPGASGAPVSITGSYLALGIHHGYSAKKKYNIANSFSDLSLAAALHGFAANLAQVSVDPANILYVDGCAATEKEPPTGNYFQPYRWLTSAFAKVGTLAAGTPALISIVTGGYADGLDDKTLDYEDIDLKFSGDITLVMPVGDVTLWPQLPGIGTTASWPQNIEYTLCNEVARVP